MPFWARSGWCKARFLFCAVRSKILRGDEVIIDKYCRYLVQARRETMTKRKTYLRAALGQNTKKGTLCGASRGHCSLGT